VTITLYSPKHGAINRTVNDFSIQDAAKLLGCVPSLVDVLAREKGYIVYTIFDCECDANPVGTQAVAELTGVDFDASNEDELLRGPVLFVKE
jgi:hypothetical protein